MKWLPGLLSILMFAIPPLPGQEPPDPSAAALPAIEETLVVTAQFMPETADASLYRVRTIKGTQIRERGLTNLRELLAFEANISLDQHSVFGSSPAIGGVTRENVKILQDGVPVVGRLNGIIDLEQIPLAGVRQVEIIEGPVSVYYGTEALAGVINLVSEEPPSSPGWQVGLDTNQRTEGDQALSLDTGFGNERHGLRLQAGQRHFDGFDANAASRAREWNQRDQLSAQLTYGYRLGNLVTSLHGRIFDEDLVDLGEPGAGTALDATYQTRRGSYDATVRGFLSKRLFFDALLSYADYRRDKTTDLTDLATGSVQPYTGPSARDTSTATQWLNRGMLTYAGLPYDGTVMAGYEVSREEGGGGRLRDGGQSVDNAAVFAGLRLETGFGLTIQPALRTSLHSDYDAPPTPALNLKYDAGDNWQARASYGRGFRGPSLKELYLDFTMPAGPFIYHIAGNPDLQAERGHNYQLSLSGRRPLPSGRLEAETSFFFNDIDHLIALGALLPDSEQPNHFERSYINIDRHRTRGGRLSSTYVAARWSAALGATYTEIANQLAQGRDLPAFNGSWDWDAQLQAAFSAAVSLNLSYKLTGRQPAFLLSSDATSGGQVIREIRTEEVHRLDLGSAFRLPRGFDLRLGVRNLLDERNQDTYFAETGAAHSSGAVEWGRSFYVAAGWRTSSK